MSQYEAPFDPADWKAIKNTMAKQTALSDSGKGWRGSDLLPPTSTSIFFKTIFFIGSMLTISAALWLGNSLFDKTKSSTSTLTPNTESAIKSANDLETEKEKNTTDLEKNPKQKKEADSNTRELNLLPELTTDKEQNPNNRFAANPLSSEKKRIQKTDSPTLNVGGAQETINPFSFSSSARNIDAILSSSEPSNVETNTPLPTNQPEKNKNQAISETIKTPEQKINSNKHKFDTNKKAKVSPIALSKDQEAVDKNAVDRIFFSSSKSTTNRSVVGLELLDLLELSTSILDTTAELDFAELSSIPDPIGSTKIKHFSFGLLIGTSYNTFESNAKAFRLSPLVGITFSHRLTNSLQVHLGLTQRFVYGTEDIKHLERLTTILHSGGGISWIYKQSLVSLAIYETPFSISYQPNTFNRFFRAFRFHGGLRPTLLFLSNKKTSESVVAVGSISAHRPNGWVTPTRQAGFKKTDFGLLMGLDLFIKKNLYLNFSGNLSFNDITDDDFWNVDPQINKNSDFQIFLRWTPINF